MTLPHTVTVYNVVTTTDASTYDEATENNITILRGVLVDEVKGRNVRESGLVGADAVTLHIPREIEAVAPDGTAKQYLDPVAYWAAADKTAYWTLSVDNGTFFVKGEVVEPTASEEAINLAHDGVYTVTKVDNKDFGGLPHWEVGGA